MMKWKAALTSVMNRKEPPWKFSTLIWLWELHRIRHSKSVCRMRTQMEALKSMSSRTGIRHKSKSIKLKSSKANKWEPLLKLELALARPLTKIAIQTLPRILLWSKTSLNQEWRVQEAALTNLSFSNQTRVNTKRWIKLPKASSPWKMVAST